MTTPALDRCISWLEARQRFLRREAEYRPESKDAADELVCALFEIKEALRKDLVRAAHHPVSDGCRTCHNNWTECVC